MCASYLESLEDNIKIDKDKCVACGKCTDRCVLDNIRLKLAPCRQACPMGVNAQGYVQLIARGEDQAARDLVREQLPFPEIICMVCDHPCETQCERGKKDGQPVNIRGLKRYLFDAAGESWAAPAKDLPTGKKIAVVGAGPAGLVAAYDLALKGHEVMVFEADGAVGGLLRGAIPPFRLPEAVVERELAVLRELGVGFTLNCRVGENLPFADLMRGYDAVVLCAGLGRGKTLGVEGENLSGVLPALPFLRASRAGNGPRLSGPAVVVGGGNMAVDAALVALRQGAESVTMLSLEDKETLPAFAAELQQARNEGVRFRHSCGVAEMSGKNGGVDAVRLSRCTAVFDEDGNFAPSFASSSEELPASHVIVAIGLERDERLLAGSGLTPRDVAQADPLTLRCGQSAVFAAGDFQGNAGSVIKAMAAGRQAAESASRHVTGRHLRFGRAYAGPFLTDFSVDLSRGVAENRVAPSCEQFQGKGDYRVLEAPLTPEEAKREAARCHSCGGPCGKHRTCWFCLPCEVECPQKALWVDIPYLLR